MITQKDIGNIEYVKSLFKKYLFMEDGLSNGISIIGIENPSLLSKKECFILGSLLSYAKLKGEDPIIIDGLSEWIYSRM